MTQKKFRKNLFQIIIFGLLYAVMFGLVIPFLVSAKSTIAFIIGACLFLLVFVFSIDRAYRMIMESNHPDQTSQSQ